MIRLVTLSVILTLTSNPLALGQHELEIDFDGHIYLKGVLNDSIELDLLLDTGADGLYLDSLFFESTGMQLGNFQLATLPGAGSQPQQIRVLLDTYSVRFSDSLDYTPRYVPLLNLRRIVGEKADGIIGLDFLRPYVSEINYEEKIINLHEELAMSSYNSFDSIHLEINRNRIYIPLSIKVRNEEYVTKFLLDLGNGGGLKFTSPSAKRLKLHEVPQKKKYFNVSGGVGGKIEGYVFRHEGLKLGNYTFRNVVSEFSTDSVGALAKSEYDGLLGNKVLSRFHIFLNIKDQILYLKPNSNYSRTFHFNMVGFKYTNHSKSLGGILVTGLYDGQSEIQVGDLIKSINGKSIKLFQSDELDKLFTTSGNTLTLDIQRNAQSFNITIQTSEEF